MSVAAMRRALWPLFLRAIPFAAPLYLAWRLLRTPWPAGHDVGVHVQNALTLDLLWRDAPELATIFLRRLEAHWPPLTYVATLLPLRVLPAPWAFHAVTLAFAAAFFLFLGLTLRRLTADRELQALAFLAIAANPLCWQVFTSYNLEPALDAGVAVLAWAALTMGRRRSVAGSALAGLLCGLALVSKLTIALYAAPLLAAVLVLGDRAAWRDRGAAARAGAFLVAVLAPPTAGYWFAAPRWWEVVGEDAYAMATSFVQPWHFYWRTLATGCAALPLFLLTALAARRIAWRQARRAWGVLLVGGLGALVAFSGVGVKRPVYFFGCCALLTLFAVAALAAAPPEARRRGVRALLGYYLLLFVLLLTPGASAAYRVLSLGAMQPTELIAQRAYNPEEMIADCLLPLVDRRPALALATLEFQDRIGFAESEMMLALRRPRFALSRGLFVADRGLATEATRRRLEEACLVIAWEREDARGPSWDALAFAPARLAAVRTPDVWRARLEAMRPELASVWRGPADGGALAAYERPSRCVSLPPTASNAATIAVNLLLNWDLRGRDVERVADALFATPRSGEGAGAAADLTRQLAPLFAAGSPPRRALLNRLFVRECERGRLEPALELLKSRTAGDDFGVTLPPDRFVRAVFSPRNERDPRFEDLARALITAAPPDVGLVGVAADRLFERLGLQGRVDEAEALAQSAPCAIGRRIGPERVVAAVFSPAALAGDPDGVERIARRLMETAPSRAPLQLLIADRLLLLYGEAGRVDAAHALEAAFAPFHDPSKAARRQADLLSLQGDATRAAAIYGVLAQSRPERLGDWRRLVDALARAGRRREEGEAIVEALGKAAPPADLQSEWLVRLFALEDAGWGDYGAENLALRALDRPAPPLFPALQALLGRQLGRGDLVVARQTVAAVADRLDVDRALTETARGLAAAERCGSAVAADRLALERNPLDGAAFGGLVACLPGLAPDAADRVIDEVMAQTPPGSVGFAQRLTELRRAALAGRGLAFARWAERALDRLPPNDRAHDALLDELVLTYGGAGQSDRAMDRLRREWSSLPPEAAPFEIWNAAELALAEGLPALAEPLLAEVAARGASLGAECLRLNDARRRTLRSPAAEAPCVFRQPVEGLSAWATARAWASWQSHRLVGRASADDAGIAPWSNDYRACHDAVALGRARRLLADDRAAEAEALLRSVEYDPELRRVAQGLLAANRRQ